MDDALDIRAGGGADSGDVSHLSSSRLMGTQVNDNSPLIYFNISKKEMFTPANGLKGVQRRLRNYSRIQLYKEEMNYSKLQDASLLVFGGPREKFTTSEFSALKQYLDRGGSILYLCGEGGDAQSNSNFNYLLEDYGMSVNSDAVVRSVYYKYFHPKEVFVANGVLNREINKAAGKRLGGGAGVTSPPGTVNGESTVVGGMLTHETEKDSHPSIQFLYPFGCTLNVQKPAVPILSSGNTSYPVNRPISAAFLSPEKKGKIVVIGSVQMFSDQYIEKEENGKLFDVLIQMLTTDKIVLNSIDASEPEVADYHHLPETQKLAENVKSCLQESEDLPKDFTSMFDSNLFKFDTSLLPNAIKLYGQLRLKHEQLSLIQPQFETPLPPLQPAVFPPALKDLPPPALDLFDLDEHFASEKARLAQLTNKCNDGDLEYYIRECGEILGVNEHLEKGKNDAKHVLDYVFRSIVNWKKLTQE